MGFLFYLLFALGHVIPHFKRCSAAESAETDPQILVTKLGK